MTVRVLLKTVINRRCCALGTISELRETYFKCKQDALAPAAAGSLIVVALFEKVNDVQRISPQEKCGHGRPHTPRA
jgi:hypothetical protein